jgi:Microtubule-binding stalk of dynein motor
MKDPKFTVPDLRVISTAGAGLLKWVLAMVNYFGVARDVEPKRRKVAESERNLRQSQKELAVIKVPQALHAIFSWKNSGEKPAMRVVFACLSVVIESQHPAIPAENDFGVRIVWL